MNSSLYAEHPTTDEIIRGVDLSGKRAIVTGGSSGLGLGLETARTLAAAAAEVILPVRDLTKGAEAVVAIRERVPQAATGLV